MKNYKFLRIFALAAIAAFLFACVHNITGIVMSERPQANAEDAITVKVQFRNGTDCNNTYLVFAALFPTNMNAAANAKVTMTTKDFNLHGYPDVTDMEMVPMEDTEVEKMSGSAWSSALMTKFGTMGNFGDFEWVVWRSADIYSLTQDSNDDPSNCTYADIKVTFTNEARNVKFNFAALAAATTFGLEDDRYCPPMSKAYQTYDGVGDENYTVPKLMTTTPVKMSYEDVFCINFVSMLDGTATAVAGETDVYLMGKVILEDGTEILVDKKHDETNRMSRTAEYEYMKYIYPRQFFGVLEGDTMVEMYFWFENIDGTKVEDAAGNLYAVAQTGTLL